MRFRLFDHTGQFIQDHVDAGGLAPLQPGDEVPLEDGTVTVETVIEDKMDIANNLLYIPVLVRRPSNPNSQ